MWHASVAPQGMPFGRATLERQAERELTGVGDADLGEWREFTGRAFHLRRRLSHAEASIVGPVLDVRGDAAEVERRMRPVAHLLPAGWSE